MYTTKLRDEYLEQLTRASYWDRLTKREIIEQALDLWMKGKEYEPVPGK